MRGARRLTYADSRMKNLLLTLLHLAVITAKLCGPGGARAVIAENLVLKQQLIVLRRGRQRAPNLTLSERLLCGFGSLFLSPGRIRKLAIAVRPSTLMAFHAALVRRKYRRLFASRSCPKKPGPKGPSEALILAIVELKSRNPRFGCPRIAPHHLAHVRRRRRQERRAPRARQTLWARQEITAPSWPPMHPAWTALFVAYILPVCALLSLARRAPRHPGRHTYFLTGP